MQNNIDTNDIKRIVEEVLNQGKPTCIEETESGKETEGEPRGSNQGEPEKKQHIFSACVQ